MNTVATKKQLWEITAEHIDPNHYFGVTVANGMIGLVSDASPMQIKDVVLNGVYDRYQRGRVSNILKGFSHLNISIAVDDRMIELENTQGYTQSLNMKTATLHTQFDAMDKVEVKHELLALRHLPYTAMAWVEVTAKEEIEITVFNNLTAPDHLQDVRNFYSEIDRPHVKIPLLSSVAKSPSGALTLAASNSYLFEEPHGEEPDLIHEDWDFNRHLCKFKKKLKAGQTYRFGIVGSICTSVHFSDPQNEAERLSIFAKLEGKDRLLKRHLQAWNQLWQSDIEIDGDDAVQKEVRFLLYHLYSFLREGTGLSLSPVGLSGLGYNGHVFWDTELWMYPPILVMHPNLAKSILDYRSDRLDAARQNAFSHGYKGAMFPWESADDGTEQTPVWALTGPFQHHITGCIAWSFWKYYQITQDKEWLHEKGWPLLRAAADFWADRVERNGPGQYNINNVIGANEFEENINDNAFTNGVAKVVLEYASQAAEDLGLKPNPDWRHVAENIPILEFEDGTTKENTTYQGQEIKQADANLLSFPLELITDKERMDKDLAFYEPRMSPDGPAMGVSVLSTLHAILGRPDKAYELFIKSYRPNGVPPFQVLAECAGGRGVSPFFITGAGGTLQSILFGFGGLKITDEGLKAGKQQLPSHWKSLKIKINGIYVH
jgi:trehalose/maltose hydrolase-like predicted phosphorylase